MLKFIALSLTVTSIIVITYTKTLSVPSTTIETRIAVVTANNNKGSYFQFIDKSGGWWLEANCNLPNFKLGQTVQFTIDNHGTEDIEDDELLLLKSFR